MTPRFLFGLLLAASSMVLLPANLLSAAEVGPGYDIEMSRMIPMRDGIGA